KRVSKYQSTAVGRQFNANSCSTGILRRFCGPRMTVPGPGQRRRADRRSAAARYPACVVISPSRLRKIQGHRADRECNAMARREILDRIEKYVDPFRITKGKGFRLKDFDPGDTCGLKLDKSEASELLQRGTEWLAEEQSMLDAQDQWSLLLIFQAMDAAG